ncbi:MAG: GNAT family N-acyltransferase [Candidatus Omnitrophota bacterium]|jgi:putative hemolysin
MENQPDKKFEVKFVENNELLDEIKYLRGQAFFAKAVKEEDEFDEYSKHLAVIDRDTNKIIGSYRLLLGSTAKNHGGFYSETEFDLSNIKKNCKGELLEMSRACVLDSYRKYPIIKFIWKEIISFVEKNDIKYIFGCPSIDEASKEHIGEVMEFFKTNCFSEEKYRVYPLAGKEYKFVAFVDKLDSKATYRTLPSLVRGYLKMGALACSEPAWDSHFKTADFFMMLEVANFSAYKEKFS